MVSFGPLVGGAVSAGAWVECRPGAGTCAPVSGPGQERGYARENSPSLSRVRLPARTPMRLLRSHNLARPAPPGTGAHPRAADGPGAASVYFLHEIRAGIRQLC